MQHVQKSIRPIKNMSVNLINKKEQVPLFQSEQLISLTLDIGKTVDLQLKLTQTNSN